MLAHQKHLLPMFSVSSQLSECVGCHCGYLRYITNTIQLKLQLNDGQKRNRWW